MSEKPSIEFTTIELKDIINKKKYRITISKDDAEQANKDKEYATNLLSFCKNHVNNSAYEIECQELTEEDVKQPTPTKRAVNTEIEDEEDSEDDSSDGEQNPPSENAAEKGPIKWTHDMILLFISAYKKRIAAYPNAGSNKPLSPKFWAGIVKYLQKKKYFVTSQQCRSKWTNLKNKYKLVKDHNAQSGNSRDNWIYFDLMDEIESKKKYMKPLATTSSVEEEKKAELDEPGCSTSRKRKNEFDFVVEVIEKNQRVKEELARERLKKWDDANKLFGEFLDFVKKSKN